MWSNSLDAPLRCEVSLQCVSNILSGCKNTKDVACVFVLHSEIFNFSG